MWLAHSFTFPAVNPIGVPTFKVRTEDAADVWWSGDVTILAVADGVASSAMAAAASKLAIATAKQITIPNALFRDQDRSDWAAYVAELRHVLQRVQAQFLEAIDGRSDAAEWQTTLALVAVVSRSLLVVASMGDSTLCFEAAQLFGEMSPVQTVIGPSGKRATHTMHDDVSHAKIWCIPVHGCTGVFLSTDGLDQYFGSDGSDSSPVVGKRISGVFEPLRAQRLGDITASFGKRAGDRKGDDLGVAMAAWRDG